MDLFAKKFFILFLKNSPFFSGAINFAESIDYSIFGEIYFIRCKSAVHTLRCDVWRGNLKNYLNKCSNNKKIKRNERTKFTPFAADDTKPHRYSSQRVDFLFFINTKSKIKISPSRCVSQKVKNLKV